MQRPGRIYVPSVLSPLVHKVCLVAYEHNDDVAPPFSPHFLNPASCVQKRLPICDQQRMSSAVILGCMHFEQMIMEGVVGLLALTGYIVHHNRN